MEDFKSELWELCARCLFIARSLVSELEQLSSLSEAELDVSERQAAIDDMRTTAAIERRIAEKLGGEEESKPSIRRGSRKSGCYAKSAFYAAELGKELENLSKSSAVSASERLVMIDDIRAVQAITERLTANIPYSSQCPEVEEWLTLNLDKLEALSPDEKVNEEMHARRIVEALSNAWLGAREQALKDGTLRDGDLSSIEAFNSLHEHLPASVFGEYFEKNMRR